MRRSVISLVAGLALAVLAVILMTSYMSSDKETAETDDNGMVRIVVAARDLPFGATIIREDLKYTEWPQASVPEGAFNTMDAILVDSVGLGGKRVALRELYASEPILTQKISGFGDKATLSRQVDTDMRAYTVRVNDVSGVAGFILPGDKVDIMLTRQTLDGGRDDLITDVILQNIEILGINQMTNQATEEPVIAKTVTVEVTTDQAQKLALAQQVGSLSLALRSYANNAPAPTSRITALDLGAGLAVEKASTREGFGIRIRRGMSIN